MMRSAQSGPANKVHSGRCWSRRTPRARRCQSVPAITRPPYQPAAGGGGQAAGRRCRVESRNRERSYSLRVLPRASAVADPDTQERTEADRFDWTRAAARGLGALQAPDGALRANRGVSASRTCWTRQRGLFPEVFGPEEGSFPGFRCRVNNPRRGLVAERFPPRELTDGVLRVPVEGAIATIVRLT